MLVSSKYDPSRIWHCRDLKTGNQYNASLTQADGIHLYVYSLTPDRTLERHVSEAELFMDFEFVPEDALYPSEGHVELSSTDIACLKRAARGIRSYGPTGVDCYTERIQNWPRFGFTSWDEGLEDVHEQFYVGFTFAGLTYGGLHLVAWNAPFPTRVEGLLWRVSSMALAASGIVICFRLAAKAVGYTDELLWPFQDAHVFSILIAQIIMFFLWVIALALWGLFYAGSRVYLVVSAL
ncbi:hypothetical protein AOQ84DRAFT_379409 [Glonium stellatum]|uniref:Uncharacterized protein n=1 Tax=Glonium stellatum TaxID=574774 RepID=A0A8E2EVD3_9PEZI|nr:hypothetical protein AOQ84DRAFT_379409 [Glonium stellatum]